MTSIGLLPILANGLTILLWIVLDLALLALALSVVRKRSSEASMIMASASVLQLLCTMGAPIANLVVARLVSPATSMVSIVTATQLIFSIFRMISFVLLLFGILKLANMKSTEVEGNPPFPSF